MELRAPFPWTGGKSWAAHLVWDALGDVDHYIEPFAGSAAVLLARPSKPSIETLNDNNHYLVNFWRAVKHDPEGVARYAENPQSEVDLYARNAYLIRNLGDFEQRLLDNPDHYDVKLAGWWVWGESTIIGRSFANDICKKMPGLIPNGVNAKGVDIPLLMQALAQRLKKVRILHGDWTRCLGPTAIGANNSPVIRSAGVFLDPPYIRGDFKYTGSGTDPRIWHAAKTWAFTHGNSPGLRIVLAGYEDEGVLPEGWRTVRWKGHGGLGRKARSNTNRDTETLWLSPHCTQHPTEDDFLALLGG